MASPGDVLQSIPEFCEEQLVLVELVSSIRVIPIDNLVQTVRSVVRQPPNIAPNVSHWSNWWDCCHSD